MYYVCNSNDSNTLFGVTDTKDGVTEYYTPEQLKEFIDLGIEIKGYYNESEIYPVSLVGREAMYTGTCLKEYALKRQTVLISSVCTFRGLDLNYGRYFYIDKETDKLVSEKCYVNGLWNGRLNVLDDQLCPMPVSHVTLIPKFNAPLVYSICDIQYMDCELANKMIEQFFTVNYRCAEKPSKGYIRVNSLEEIVKAYRNREPITDCNTGVSYDFYSYVAYTDYYFLAKDRPDYVMPVFKWSHLFTEKWEVSLRLEDVKTHPISQAHADLGMVLSPKVGFRTKNKWSYASFARSHSHALILHRVVTRQSIQFKYLSSYGNTPKVIHLDELIGVFKDGSLSHSELLECPQIEYCPDLGVIRIETLAGKYEYNIKAFNRSYGRVSGGGDNQEKVLRRFGGKGLSDIWQNGELHRLEASNDGFLDIPKSCTAVVDGAFKVDERVKGIRLQGDISRFSIRAFAPIYNLFSPNNFTMSIDKGVSYKTARGLMRAVLWHNVTESFLMHYSGLTMDVNEGNVRQFLYAYFAVDDSFVPTKTLLVNSQYNGRIVLKNNDFTDFLNADVVRDVIGELVAKELKNFKSFDTLDFNWKSGKSRLVIDVQYEESFFKEFWERTTWYRFFVRYYVVLSGYTFLRDFLEYQSRMHFDLLFTEAYRRFIRKLNEICTKEHLFAEGYMSRSGNGYRLTHLLSANIDWDNLPALRLD